MRKVIHEVSNRYHLEAIDELDSGDWRFVGAYSTKSEAIREADSTTVWMHVRVVDTGATS